MERKGTQLFNRRVMVIISLAVFLLVSALAVAHYNLSIQDANRMARKYLTAITEGVRETVDAWLLEKCNLVHLLATSPEIRGIARGNLDEAKPVLRHFFEVMEGYEAVFLADRDGVIRVDTHLERTGSLVDIKFRSYWPSFSEKDFRLLLNPVIERSPVTGKLVFVIIEGIRDENDALLGFIGTSIDWEQFLDKFLLPVKVGNTGYVAITDLKGRNIGHLDKSLNLEDLSSEPWMQRVILEKNGFQHYWFRDQIKFMAYSQSSQSGWIVHSMINESELIQGAIYNRNLFLMLGMILLILLLLTVGYLDVFRLSRAMEQLRQSKTRFQLIFNRGNDGIFIHSLDRQGQPGTFTQVNRKFLSILQLPHHEVIGKSAARIIGDSVASDYPALLRDVLHDKYRMLESSILRSTGEKTHVEFRLFLIESREELAVMGFVRDITLRIRSRQELRRNRDELDLKVKARTLELEAAHQKLQQQFHATEEVAAALRESEAKYRSLIERASDGILMVEEGRVVFANEKIMEMLSFPWSELAGIDLSRIVAPHHRDTVMSSYFTRLQGPRRNAIYETRLLRKGGDELPVELNAGLIDYNGRPVDFIFVRDITLRKQAEETERRNREQLIQTDKLAALGTLVSGVAHEINNPNNTILLNVSILAEAWRDAQPIFKDYREQNGDFQIAGMPYDRLKESIATAMEDIEDGAWRIKNIVEDLKDFARPGNADMSEGVPVNDVVRSAIKLISNQIMKTTDHFSIHYDESIPPIRGNFRRLEQVVVNLLQNACHALSERSQSITVGTGFHENGTVFIEVADEGVGIPPENMNQIMNPFFTTKRDRGGTGLGLSVSLSLVKDHGGDLQIQSEPGQGTRIRVLIPLPDRDEAKEAEHGE